MKRKSITTIMTILFLASMLIVVFNAAPVKAQTPVVTANSARARR